jgi:ATP-dependent Lhr-like helicase
MTADNGFHPVVRTWFQGRFAAPTEAQAAGWPQIMAGRDTLISAPTGSGKTLAAFLVSIDRLIKQAERDGGLEDKVSAVYVSPLKALSSDIRRNLEEPLEEMAEIAREMGLSLELRTALRTGDTTQAEREQIIKRPPHILITTPESLYLMVTAERSREILRTVRTVIVDEIHALIRDKRGSHLALTLARLDHITTSPASREAGEDTPLPHELGEPVLRSVEGGLGVRAQRVGLSATVKPIEDAARFLVGAGQGDAAHATGSGRAAPDCVIVNEGHQRDIQISIEAPPTEMQAVASGDQWRDIYDRLAEIIKRHRTTLVFVNTRRLSERVAFALAERLGEDPATGSGVGAHHGSLSKERRLNLEQRLKAGEMKALVATASLELGIDIGSVDLVCQLESPRSITAFLQRAGRSGHALGLTPRGILFPTTRDELAECAALVRAVKQGRLDRVYPPVAPLDILAQQIVAEVACEPWNEDELYALIRRAAPYAGLSREKFDEIIEMLSEGIAVGSGRVAAYIHRDRINGVLRGRRGARSTAIQCGGAIPEIADYRVIAEPEGAFVGTLDEDFSIESMAGDIILLGTTSWRIKRIESGGIVRVEDAHGLPPTVPFWLGEAPGRTLELSEEVSRLREDIAARLAATPARAPGAPAESASGAETGRGGPDGAGPEENLHLTQWLEAECGLPPEAAEQLIRYVRAERDSIGVVPTQREIVFERFFDESGGQQLVVHAPFGARINRAWGLALRKRFCVGFDFELQAAASDDAMLLSIGPNNSFPLEAMFDLVKPDWVEESVEQSLLIAPMFNARWRWNTTRALAILRQRNGRRVPPPLQRMKADDLLAAVFPRLVSCQENVTGPIEIPDHPLVRQTVNDCMHEAMDIDGLKGVLERVERGEIRYHAKDTAEPSPFAHEILNSKPYTYLDDAPLEERRARAVVLRRTLPENARDLGVLDDEAIARVQDEAWPQPRDAEELHDVLLALTAVRESDAGDWGAWFDELIDSGRAGVAGTAAGARLWFAAENLRLIEKLYAGAAIQPELRLPPELDVEAEEDEGRLGLVRGHIEVLGPVTVAELAARTGLKTGAVNSALAQLEGGGTVLRGRFRAEIEEEEEWCDRRLLARIHRYTLDRLRAEIEPVSIQDFTRFLLRWQHVAPGTQLEGKRGLLEAVAQLQGCDIPAIAWERHILPHRVAAFKGSWLDELCLSGDIAWARLGPRKNGNGAPAHPEVSKGEVSKGEVSKGEVSKGEVSKDGPLHMRTRSRTSRAGATPVSLMRRADAPYLLRGVRGDAGPGAPEAGAGRDILDILAARGALFFDDIAAGTRRLPTDVERGLWELVARGLVTADGFQALRSLMASTRKRNFRRPQRARLFRTLAVGGDPSGRWSLLPSAIPANVGAPLAAPAHPEVSKGEVSKGEVSKGHPEVRKEGASSAEAEESKPVLSAGEGPERGNGQTAPQGPDTPTPGDLAEFWAEQLLFRYGVVFRDLTQREAFAVPWRDILRALRRMEAQGLVRGGRFVAGVYGEQYARPEAVEALRKVRRAEKTGEIVRISAVDPLNLTGIIFPGPRTPSVHTNAVFYRDGIPLTDEEAAAAIEEARRVIAEARKR